MTARPLGWLGLMDEEAIRLDEAALALALADAPDADPTPAQEIYEAMLRRLSDRGAGVGQPVAQARMLATVVATEEGFRGDAATYDAPENADWIQTFRRRRALPVTLAILYVSLARRLGWEANILGVPGHVLVMVGRPPAAVLIDAFESGSLLGLPAAADYARRALGRHARLLPEHVAPLSNRAALVRLVANPAQRAARAGDMARARTLTRRMADVAPGYPALWWELARLEQLTGDVPAARRALAAMREVTREPELLRRIAMALETLSS